MGVYQQYNYRTQKSTWILLQPSVNVRRLLGETLKEHAKDASITSSHPMAVHLLFLFSTAKNWNDYIGALRSALKALVSQDSSKVAQRECADKFSGRKSLFLTGGTQA